jgi:hypothetical protein
MWHMRDADERLKRYSGREGAAYCSAACRKAHWRMHKAHCEAQPKIRGRLQMLDMNVHKSICHISPHTLAILTTFLPIQTSNT